MGVCWGYMGVPGMAFAPQFISWPEKDESGALRKDQFWAYYMEVMGSKILFMFALTPHVPDEKYQAAIKSFETNHGIPCQVWKKLPWKPDYKEGSEGDKLELYKDYIKPEQDRSCTVS